MKTFLSSTAALLFVSLFLGTVPKAHAQDFVYTPKNPAFGGSYLNYQWLLSSANAQNPYQGSTSFGYNSDPLANFQEQLQRQILSQLTRDIIQERFGEVDLSQQNTFQFGEFSIDIIPGVNGIDISILDQSSGKQTTVTIPSL